jgi:hypothetical protein
MKYRARFNLVLNNAINPQVDLVSVILAENRFMRFAYGKTCRMGFKPVNT